MALKPKTAALIALISLLGLTTERVYHLSKLPPAPAPTGNVPPAGATDHRSAPPPTPTPAPEKSAAPPNPSSALQSQIERLLAKLQNGTATTEDLAQLEQQLLAANPAIAIAAIVDFLATGKDASTGQGFVVGPKGALTSGPTLRVKLMDILGQLARKTSSPAAAKVAREILDNKTSADEWAISLRNVGWTQPQSATYLAGKFREMLSYKPWLESPSPGMLESFDVPVFTRDASFVPTLSALVTNSTPNLQRAAAIALDRLSEAAPLEVMYLLNANPQTMAERPFARADYFAKANLADPMQRAAVETYLSRSDIALAEKTKFVRALASPGSFVSDSLLSSPPPPLLDDSQRIAAVTKTTQGWLKSPRFQSLHAELQNLNNLLAQ